MKTFSITLSILFVSAFIFTPFAQSADNNTVAPVITVEECIAKAKVNYPLYKNKKLIEETLQLGLTKADMAFIPNLKFSGKASYQSEVTEMPFSFPGYDFKMNKDQYQFNAEISQPIFDAGNLWASKDALRSKSVSDYADLDTKLYNIQASVMNVYFGILLINEQLAQNALYLDELERNYKTVENYNKNGVGQKSDLDIIGVEIITALKNKDDMLSKRESYYDSLAQFIGENPQNYTLAVPNNNEKLKELEVSPLFSSVDKKSYTIDYSSLSELLKNRPEIAYYDAKGIEIESTKKTNLVKGLPTLDVFLQGGYSNPGLNFLKSGFSPYYVAGIRLNWNFTGLYTKNKEDEIIVKQKLQLINQKDEFLFNSEMSIKQNIREIRSLGEQLLMDDRIITLRTSIVKASESKLKNGVLSVTDLLTEINKLNTARVDKSYRSIELLVKIYSLKQTLNIWGDKIY